jgi:hypothetical protein
VRSILALLRQKVVRGVALVLAILAALVAFLVWETTVAGIPASLVTQYTVLKSIPAGLWPVFAMIALAAFFGALALGPDLIQKWTKTASDWRHASSRRIEQLEADNKQLRADKTALQDRVAAYESAGVAKLVANVPNPGPVFIPEDEPYLIDRPEYIGGQGPFVCIVPFNHAEPATTIDVENKDDEFDVVVSYEVESVADHYSATAWTINLETRVQVLDDNGEPITSARIDKGETKIDDDGSWQHTVTGRSALVGLAKGKYDLRVVDYFTTTLGHRHKPQREYRNMRMRVTRR